MENIITELIDILKSHSTVLAKEKAAVVFLMSVIKEIVAQALEQVDDSLIEEQKEKGSQIEKKTFGRLLQ